MASSLFPSCLLFSEVLRLRKSVKPLCEEDHEDHAALLPTIQVALVAVKEDGEQQQGVLRE